MPEPPEPSETRRQARTDALWERITELTRTSTEALHRAQAVEGLHSSLQGRVASMEESLDALSQTVRTRFDDLDAAMKGELATTLADMDKRVRKFEGYVIQFNSIDDHRREGQSKIEEQIAILRQRLDDGKADGAAEKSRQEARMCAIESDMTVVKGDVTLIKDKFGAIDDSMGAVQQILEEHGAARRLAEEERRRESVASALRQERLRLGVSALSTALSRLILVLVTATCTLFVSTNPATPNPVRGAFVTADIVLAVVIGALTLWTIVHQHTTRGETTPDRSA